MAVFAFAALPGAMFSKGAESPVMHVQLKPPPSPHYNSIRTLRDVLFLMCAVIDVPERHL